tara:strand:+ start:4773 stop:5000 length:228 start_codon:yes stop_codon:yes gene_type:complete
MSIKRKIRRNLEKKEKKKAKKKIEHTISKIKSSPGKCSVCNALFDVKNNFHLDNWMIKASEQGVEMFCDACKGNI